MPQADHARFAAALALHWADRPPLPFDSFVRGVADHDRGYGEHDDDSIDGPMSEEHWLDIQRRSFTPRGEDTVVDLVAALHVRRLIGDRPAGDDAAAIVEELCAMSGVTREDAQAADLVTNVCDVISFELCFEQPSEREVRGYSLVLDGVGAVTVDPLPFDTPELRGLVTAYELDGYPGRLVPVVVPYRVAP
ncbi:MAG TPA: hypothetical protein VG327_07820 [Mycobacterium sp.]|nr:hypothetical protein [Mycobacterium sp.]